MHNPSDEELDALQDEALARSDDAAAALDRYVCALADRDEAIDEDSPNLPWYEAETVVTRMELDFQLDRLKL